MAGAGESSGVITSLALSGSGFVVDDRRFVDCLVVSTIAIVNKMMNEMMNDVRRSRNHLPYVCSVSKI